MPDLKEQPLCMKFHLKLGGNAMDKSIKGSLFSRQENYVLTLVRMGEPVTSSAATYGSN